MTPIKQTALAAALAVITAPALAADFQQLDSNRDQQLSRSELQSFAQQQQQSVDQILQSFDRDQNQQLSQQEFSSVTAAPMQAAEADADTAQPLAASPSQLDTENASEQASDQTAAGPERTTITVNEKPAKITVSNTAPKVIVQQPKPEVSITTQEPVVNVEQAEPQVSVQQAEPNVAVDPGQPAVDVEQAEPQVAVEQPEPQVAVEQPEPEVAAEVAEPVVTEPEVNSGVIEREPLPAESQPISGTTGVVEQPLVNVGTAADWRSRSVGDLQGETLYDHNGQAMGEIVEVVLDAAQQPGLLVEAPDQTDMKFVPLAEVQPEQDQLRVSGADRVQSVGDLLEGDGSRLQTITDPNRSVESLLDGNAVSAR